MSIIKHIFLVISLMLIGYAPVTSLSAENIGGVDCASIQDEYRRLVEIAQNEDAFALGVFMVEQMILSGEDVPDEIQEKIRIGDPFLQQGSGLRLRTIFDLKFKSAVGVGLKNIKSEHIVAEVVDANFEDKVLVRFSYLGQPLETQYYSLRNGEIDPFSGILPEEEKVLRREKKHQLEQLIRAIEREDWEAFIALLDNGAPLWSEDGNNPLVAAIAFDHPDYTQELINRGADPDWWMNLGISIHEYAYRMKAIPHLKIMGKYELYEEKLAENVLTAEGERPAYLIGNWSHGTEMAESTVSLQSNGTGFLIQAVMGGANVCGILMVMR
ncbi:ankyrin repeat domain-containing protein [Verrucomicrobia bacterium S94]|nr:ankyrin repeat domain-containing protein [Verrucomicrobia bacterium S94]